MGTNKQYTVVSVCKEDMTGQGFSKKDIDKLTDDDMEHIARKMAGDGMMEEFWLSLDYILEDRYNLKKV